MLQLWLGLGWPSAARGQFRALEGLPWCPPRPDALAADAAGLHVTPHLLADALQAGRYSVVVDELYPRALREGYQRSALLYDQTRQALRRLLLADGGERYWPAMQQLYAARFEYLGREPYVARATLYTRAWCDEQLDNERLAMQRYAAAGPSSLAAAGADSAVVAMEARRRAAQEALRAADDSLSATVLARRGYAEAADLYRRHRLASAYACVEALLADGSPSREACLLRAHILRAAAHEAGAMADRVAFWCAAYEAGRGYADASSQQQLVAALRAHLFMTGLAGEVHVTAAPFRIRQRIFTLDELRNL